MNFELNFPFSDKIKKSTLLSWIDYYRKHHSISEKSSQSKLLTFVIQRIPIYRWCVKTIELRKNENVKSRHQDLSTNFENIQWSTVKTNAPAMLTDFYTILMSHPLWLQEEMMYFRTLWKILNKISFSLLIVLSFIYLHHLKGILNWSILTAVEYNLSTRIDLY